MLKLVGSSHHDGRNVTAYEQAQKTITKNDGFVGSPFEQAQQAVIEKGGFEGSPFEQAQKTIFRNSRLEGPPVERAQRAYNTKEKLKLEVESSKNNVPPGVCEKEEKREDTPPLVDRVTALAINTIQNSIL